MPSFAGFFGSSKEPEYEEGWFKEMPKTVFWDIRLTRLVLDTGVKLRDQPREVHLE